MLLIPTVALADETQIALESKTGTEVIQIDLTEPLSEGIYLGNGLESMNLTTEDECIILLPMLLAMIP